MCILLQKLLSDKSAPIIWGLIRSGLELIASAPPCCPWLNKRVSYSGGMQHSCWRAWVSGFGHHLLITIFWCLCEKSRQSHFKTKLASLCHRFRKQMQCVIRFSNTLFLSVSIWVGSNTGPKAQLSARAAPDGRKVRVMGYARRPCREAGRVCSGCVWPGWGEQVRGSGTDSWTWLLDSLQCQPKKQNDP